VDGQQQRKSYPGAKRRQQWFHKHMRFHLQTEGTLPAIKLELR
jgi:hypothetical protein